ncbi:MAG TPA: adenylate/guanylate cyclase domain-containing protein [Gemmatimonadota bacterium]|nr:adenylate/guanylate cyclase domain-containing protein [Gemmatimonadota bacterium]
MTGLSHRLAAVWFADVVGYSQLMSENEGQAVAVVRQLQAVCREIVQAGGGRVIKFLGDGALAEFPSTDSAVRAAIAVQLAFAERSRAGGHGSHELRIGVHVGDVVASEDGDLYGDGINVASRLQAAAEPGQVLVSGEVWRQLKPRPEFSFESLGARTLKGIDGPVEAYAASMDPAAAATWAPIPVDASARARAGVLAKLGGAALPVVVFLYLVASWIVVQLTGSLIESFGLPDWLAPVALGLLLVGLVIVSATAWVQTRPRARAVHAPGAWDLALGDAGRSLARGRLPHLTWSRAIAGGVFAFSLLFGLAGLYVVIKDRGRSFSPEEAVAEAAPGLAVLPFSVQGAGLDEWREGMVDLLSTNLDGAGDLRAIDSRTVLARWREAAGGEDPDLETALEVGRRAGARFALLGSVVSIGDGVRLSADVYDVDGGAKLGSGSVEGSQDSVFMLVDRLSIEILRAIGGDPGATGSVNLARATTTSLPALKAFMEGEVLYRRGDFRAAVPAYERAVEADSTFALALYRLSTSYGWAESITSELATGAIERAARFADRLPERDALLVRTELALQRGTLDGLELARLATRRYPDDPEAWYTLGEMIYHYNEGLNLKREESDAAFARALQLDPGFGPAWIHRSDLAFSVYDDSVRARAFTDSLALLAPQSVYVARARTAWQLAYADSAAADRAWAVLDTATTYSPFALFAAQLWGPRFLPLQDRLGELQTRKSTGANWGPVISTWARMGRGRMRAGIESLEDPDIRPHWKGYGAYWFRVQGIPVPPDMLDDALAPGTVDSTDAASLFLAAAWALDRNRDAESTALAGQIRDLGARQLAEGDSTTAGQTTAMWEALDGFEDLRGGRWEEALRKLQAARPRIAGQTGDWIVNLTIGWWTAELLVDLGRPAEAVPYFESITSTPVAQLELGKIYEGLGDREKALAAYEEFVNAFDQPDPDVVALAEEGRQGVIRMRGLRRE